MLIESVDLHWVPHLHVDYRSEREPAQDDGRQTTLERLSEFTRARGLWTVPFSVPGALPVETLQAGVHKPKAQRGQVRAATLIRDAQ